MTVLATAQDKLLTERRPLAALGDVVEQWHRLAERAAEPNVFYDPGFALAAAPVLGRGVEVILVWSAGTPRRLLGLFPFAIRRRRYLVRLPMLVGWTHRFGPLGTPLVDRDAGDAAVAAFLDHVAADETLPKLILMPLLNEGGPVFAMLISAVWHRDGDGAPVGRHRRALIKPASERSGYFRTRYQQQAPQGTSPPTPSAGRRW